MKKVILALSLLMVMAVVAYALAPFGGRKGSGVFIDKPYLIAENVMAADTMNIVSTNEDTTAGFALIDPIRGIPDIVRFIFYAREIGSNTTQDSLSVDLDGYAKMDTLAGANWTECIANVDVLTPSATASGAATWGLTAAQLLQLPPFGTLRMGWTGGAGANADTVILRVDCIRAWNK